MAVLEGVGDEVTLLFGLLAALLLLALAWLSTRTGHRGQPDPPLDPPLDPQRPPHDGTSRQEEEQEQEEEAGEEGPGRPGRPPGALRRRTSLGSPERPADPAAGGGGGGGGPEDRPAGDSFTLRLKFLNDTERLARVRPDDTVGSLKRAAFPGQEDLVRLIYRGQWLRDDAQPLRALPLAPRSVLHCHLLRPRPAPRPAPSGPGPAPSSSSSGVGGLLVPLLALLVGALWSLQLQHRHLFPAAATACLAALTLLAALLAFALHRT